MGQLIRAGPNENNNPLINAPADDPPCSPVLGLGFFRERQRERERGEGEKREENPTPPICHDG